MALRDDASAPTFIETLPKQGYRFISAVHGPNAGPGVLVNPRRARNPYKMRLAWIGVGAALLLVVSGSVFRSRSAGPSLEVTSVRMVALPGIETDPAVSPDGSTILFSWTGESGDRPGLYMIPLRVARFVKLLRPPIPTFQEFGLGMADRLRSSVAG